jgi:hypothetical protein
MRKKKPTPACRLCRLQLPSWEVHIKLHDERHDWANLRCSECGAPFSESDSRWRDMSFWAHFCGDGRQGTLPYAGKFL